MDAGLTLWLVTAAVVAVIALLTAVVYRQVVETNMVHIVQSRKRTKSFGTGSTNGNVYYSWPSWLPMFGVKVIALPVSNFDLSLVQYAAYDKDRVPFHVDVVAFFRISDTNVTAQRVAGIIELKKQLLQIVEGAVRRILASEVIDSIMIERSKFGDLFTQEVEAQLAEWGVEPVKSMELMDIRDTAGSQVVENIMAKKKSHIEMESRVEVAGNLRTAEIAEIDAKQATDLRAQEAEQAVGERTAEKNKEVGIADQKAAQKIKAETAITADKEMDVRRVQQVRQAEITREQEVVSANRDQQTTVIIADGALEATKKRAEGVQIEGEAKASAEKAMQLAPVEAQIALAKVIGANHEYQQYLATIEGIAGYIAVGQEQAKALQAAEVKVIANAGRPTDGATDVMNLFSSRGGTELGAVMEGFAQTPLGRAALAAIGVGKIDAPTAATPTSVDPAPVEPPPIEPAAEASKDAA